MEFVGLAVEKCMEIFDREKSAIERMQAADSRAHHAVPPRAMLIHFGKGTLIREKADFQSLTDVEKAWYYADGILKETDPSREWMQEPIAGYFAEAFAEFMLDEEAQRVWLNYYFAPLCARGMSFLVERQNGSVKLCDERHHWVS